MKKLFRLIFLGLFICFSACTKSNDTPETTLNETIDSIKAEILFTGMFRNGPSGTVSGTVKIYRENDSLFVSLQDFMSSNGPDLHVYLSQEEFPIHFIELGKLKSTTGNQIYKIVRQPDFNLYSYVLIHCQQYNHLFGIGQLNK